MKIKAALEIVLQCAQAHANGHEKCAPIHEAIKAVREARRAAKERGERLEQSELFKP